MLAAVFIAVLMTTPVPKWAGRAMESTLGANHPAVACVREPEIKCTWEKFFRIHLLIGLKKALPTDSRLRATLDDMIEIYSNPYRQDQWNRRYEQADRYFKYGSRGPSRSYGSYRR